MTPAGYTEDTLVQQTTAEYLEQQLGWQSVRAYNNEGLRPAACWHTFRETGQMIFWQDMTLQLQLKAWLPCGLDTQ